MQNTQVEFINLTPHRIVLRSDAGEETIEPSGDIARVESKETALGATANGIPLYARSFGKVEGLPEPASAAYLDWGDDDGNAVFNPRVKGAGDLAETTIYIVSALVLSAVPHRRDVAAPDTGATAIRNDAGHIVGVTRLIMNPGAVVEDEDCAF